MTRPRAADRAGPERRRCSRLPTSRDDRRSAAKGAAALGADDFLPKPSDALSDPAGFSLSALWGPSGRGSG